MRDPAPASHNGKETRQAGADIKKEVKHELIQSQLILIDPATKRGVQVFPDTETTELTQHLCRHGLETHNTSSIDERRR